MCGVELYKMGPSGSRNQSPQDCFMGFFIPDLTSIIANKETYEEKKYQKDVVID